jgi:hypothetical protein
MRFVGILPQGSFVKTQCSSILDFEMSVALL